jgi:hypothetical protein
MTTTPRSRSFLAVASAAALIAACSGGNEVADITTSVTPNAPAVEAVSTSAAPVAVTTADTAVTVVGSTVDPVDATTAPTDADPATPTDGLTGPMFSDDLGVRVDTAPGVHTRGDTRQLLPEGLYVHIAWEADPDDPSVFTVQPDDIPILEAYANAVATYYRAATTTLTTDDPDFAKYYVDAGAKYLDSFGEARAGNFIASLGVGVVLRPYVLADQTTATTAVVLDCYLQDEQFLSGGSPPQLGELETTGQIATMTISEGAWKIDIAAGEARACL